MHAHYPLSQTNLQTSSLHGYSDPQTAPSISAHGLAVSRAAPPSAQ